MEGWRDLPQSFAIVNAFQCLAMLARRDVTLFHREAPLPPRNMLSVGRAWSRDDTLFAEADRRALSALPALAADERPDVTLRIHFPANLGAGSGARTFVFCVTESGPLPAYMIGAGHSVAALPAGVDLITPSAWSRRGLLAGGAPADRMHVVPHGVATDIFRPLEPAAREALRRRLGWQDAFVYLNVSNLYPWKGIATLLEGFAAVAGRHPHVRLMLKGTDSVYASRRSLDTFGARLSGASRALVAPRVQYTGTNHSFADMASFYQAADALVAPYHAEGFNLPVLEALACGTPVICTAGGPTDEFGGNCLLRIASREVPLAEPGRYQLEPDPAELAELMERVVVDPTIAARLRREAPRHVQENYTWARVTERLVEVLRGA